MDVSGEPRYQIIRARHDEGADLPYVPEASRIMNAMSAACGELIGGSHAVSANAAIREMIAWYRSHALPHLKQAIASHPPTHSLTRTP